MDTILQKLDFSGFDTAVLTVSSKGTLSHKGEEFEKLYQFVFAQANPPAEAVGVRFTTPAPVRNVIFVPLPETPSYSDVEKGFAKAAAEAVRLEAKQVLLVLDGTLSPELSGKAFETVLLASYRFERYHSEKKEAPAYSFYSSQDVRAEAMEGELLAKVTNSARDLINEPANVLTPEALGKVAVEAGLSCGFSTQVLEPSQIEQLGMHSFLAVGRGGANTPRLIVMRYTADKNNKEILGLIGKGITYDSGGYCIKGCEGMSTMKGDMGGAAAVIAAMKAIATQKLPINVVGVIAACENMISGDAYRAGDIIGSMAGKTIEVLNTDAEGRLTLVDAVTYAIREEKATALVDIATLTGAAIVALGDKITAVLSSDNELYAALEGASVRSCEKIWRLPCDEELGSRLKSPIADLKNVAGREAGTIVAGMFIKKFTEDLPWAHLDIAGTSYVKKDTALCPIGGTGSGARLLYHLTKARAKQ